MINKRMLALAGALLLIVPFGLSRADPKSDVYEVQSEIEAQVSNVNLLQPAVNGSPINVGVMPEQVVEGHTTFVTIEAEVNGTPVNGTVTVDGFVSCTHHGEVTDSGGYWLNTPFGTVFVPYPTGVKDVNVECHVGERVIITPTAYCTVTGDFQCGSNDTNLPLLFATGNIFPFTTPTGESAYAEEYSFDRVVDDGIGGLMTKTYYAWATPILVPWLDDSGAPQNMRLPMPTERLAEMPDVDHFHALYENKVHKG